MTSSDLIAVGLAIGLGLYVTVIGLAALSRLTRFRAPRVIARFLERIPVAGRLASAVRRHPLTVGLLVSLAIGLIIPWILFFVYFLLAAALVMGVTYVVVRSGALEEALGETTSTCKSNCSKPDWVRLYFFDMY